ncbi:MAG: hypothetical protein KDA44_06590 [Planctomycetales bacterium]|nr:hypothetical protein [Planctomycetales bacterium]
MTLPRGPSLTDESAVWTAVYTRPRQEKALAWDLCRKGVPYFLPMVERVTSSGGRRRRNLYPLFASYVFCSARDDDRLAVLKTERALHFLDVQPCQQAQFRREIASLECGLRNAPSEVAIYPKLVAGARVRVTGGPLKDAEGVIINADRKTKLLLGVTVMGGGAVVEIHADMVEPLRASEGEASHGSIEYQVGEDAFVAVERLPRGKQSVPPVPRGKTSLPRVVRERPH